MIRQRASTANLTICSRKRRTDVGFSCVCRVSDSEFLHKIVNNNILLMKFFLSFVFFISLLRVILITLSLLFPYLLPTYLLTYLQYSFSGLKEQLALSTSEFSSSICLYIIHCSQRNIN